MRVQPILLFLTATCVWSLAFPSWADVALATSKNCLSCHQTDRKLVGPAFFEVAKRYANDPKASATLASKIQKGGSGVWGVIPMPAHPQVSEAEAQKLAAWVLSLH